MKTLHRQLHFPFPILQESFNKTFLGLTDDVHLFKDKNYRILVFDNQSTMTEQAINFFEEIKLPVTSPSMVFICAPSSSGFIHKDVHHNPDWNGKYCHASLCLHLTSYPGRLQWYDVDELGEIERTEVDTPYETWNDSPSIIGECCSILPTLIKTNIAHQAINDSIDNLRATFTIRFQGNPDWDTVCNKLKYHLIDT
jgi:hypothetical protein